MEHNGYVMEDHALACNSCYSWATSGIYGNDPNCPTGREIRANVRKEHQIAWNNTTN